MPITLRPGTGSASNVVEVLAALDSLAPYGVRTDHPKIKPARKAADRVREVRQSNETIRAHASGGADNALTKIAETYARGDLAPDDVPERVGHVAALRNGNDALRTVLARAEAVASAPGIRALAELGDTWVVEIVRPAVDAALAALTDEVVEGAWQALHMPEHEVKHDRPRRDALDRLRDATARLDVLADYVTSLRNVGWVPTPRRRNGPTAEDMRWLHCDRLSGDLGDYEAFFVLNLRNGAEPGVWTAAEWERANPTLGSDEPPKPPRGGDAHLLNGGKREVA